MFFRVRERPNASAHFIYHKGLIKLLIEFQLRKAGRTWEHFLLWGGFELQTVKPKRGRKKVEKIKSSNQKTLNNGPHLYKQEVNKRWNQFLL